MSFLRCTRGNISTLTAFSLTLLLLGVIVISFTLLLDNQNQSTTTGVETQKQTLKSVREQLQATLQNIINNQLHINTQNIGQVTTEITHLLITKPDNTLQTLNLTPTKILLPLEKQTLTLTYSQEFTKLGLLTKKGNIFPIQTNPPPQPTSPTPNPTTSPATPTPTVPTSTSPTPPPSTPIPTSTSTPTLTPTFTPSPSPSPPPTGVPFNFTLSLSSSSGSIEPGGQVSLTVTVTLLSGLSQQVTLSASGLPTNAHAAFTPTNGVPTFTSTLTITLAANTPANSYTITITGVSGEVTRTATYTLTVTTQPFEFNLSIAPSSSTITAGNNATATLTVSHLSGTPKPVRLSVYTDGTLATLNPTSGTPTPSFTSTLTITNPPQGTYNLIIYSTTDTATKSVTYTLTVNPQPTPTIRFYLYGAENGVPLTVDGKPYPAHEFPLTFTWPVGSRHTYAWTSFQTDQSPYIPGVDTGYSWTSSTSTNNLPTALSGSLTVPVAGGTIIGHYTRHIYIQTEPSTQGTINPPSGWHLPGTIFTATPHPNYQFTHWTINSATNTNNPLPLHHPASLQATFTSTTLPLTVNVRDYQGYPINGATIYLYTSQQSLYDASSTNPSGTVTFHAPPGSYYLAAMQTITAFNYPTTFHNWNDGSTTPIKQISLTRPASYTATYKTSLTFQNLQGGIGTNGFSTGYWATGTITTTHGTPIGGVGIQVTWNPNNPLERSATTTTTSNGAFNAQTYLGLITPDIYAIDFHMTNTPYGYQPQTNHRFYP